MMSSLRLLIAVLILIFQETFCAAQFLVRPTADVNQPVQVASGEELPAASITIPSGTTVRMRLKSPINTVSAPVGSGLYLETTADVIQQNRIVIPAKTLVQGVVERQERPGRVKGRGQLQFHFTTLILPSNYTASIAGSLQSLPGSKLYESVNREGAFQPVDQIDKDAAAIVSSVVAGAAIGSVTHGAFRAGRGSLIGAGFGLGTVLFKRGDDMHLPEGTAVEMVLDRSFTIPLRELTAYTQRSEIPLTKETPVPAIPERKRPTLPSSANVAIVPGGIPEVRFRW